MSRRSGLALRQPAVREYREKVEYIHLNPVKAGWVDRPITEGGSVANTLRGCPDIPIIKCTPSKV